jgi:hypothetical protein
MKRSQPKNKMIVDEERRPHQRAKFQIISPLIWEGEGQTKCNQPVTDRSVERDHQVTDRQFLTKTMADMTRILSHP